MKRYFIIGTDTDAGKTHVTCQLLDYFKAHDQIAGAIKPVASGCFDRLGQLVSEDELQLQRHNHEVQQVISQWRFLRPISPHLAAIDTGEGLSAKAIVDFCNEAASPHLDYLFIEGAGGLMSPLNDTETWLDVLSVSQIPVILVVGMKLGCLNHALLTALAFKTRNIDCAGWIANCLDREMLALSENIKTLSDMLDRPLLATLGYGEAFSGGVLDLL